MLEALKEEVFKAKHRPGKTWTGDFHLGQR
jgi:hypothetical protein